MARPARALRVCVNPYLVTDADGDPCCVVQLDPQDPRYPQNATGWRGSVGARIASAVVVRAGDDGLTVNAAVQPGTESRSLRGARSEIKFEFTREPFDLPDTAYYRRMIGDLSLIAADEFTANACRVPFADPELIRSNIKKTMGANEARWIAIPGPAPEPEAASEAAQTTDEV